MSDIQDPAGENWEERAADNSESASAEVGESLDVIDREEHIKEDAKSYAAGEVPQSYLFDPERFLPLNSEKLLKKAKIERSIEELEQVTRDEITSIHKFQRAIDEWEKTIDKDKALIDRNKMVIRQNNTDISYDEKNRDYWWRRAENVAGDVGVAAASNDKDTWAWFIKKHGLKTAEGTPIDETSGCVEELCNGSSNNLVAKYKVAGNKYDMAKNHREKENLRLISENAHYKKTVSTLQRYVQSTYQNKVEPLQDGVLLLKELIAKLRGFLSQPEATFGDLREWAEAFLNQYLIENPQTPQHAITDFRKWASIPLPSENH